MLIVPRTRCVDTCARRPHTVGAMFVRHHAVNGQRVPYHRAPVQSLTRLPSNSVSHISCHPFLPHAGHWGLVDGARVGRPRSRAARLCRIGGSVATVGSGSRDKYCRLVEGMNYGPLQGRLGGHRRMCRRRERSSGGSRRTVRGRANIRSTH